MLGAAGALVLLLSRTLDGRHGRVGCHGSADHSGRRAADLVGVGLDAELVDVGEAVVERALVPKAIFRAADAAVAGLDREARALVPSRRRAGVVGGRTLATDLVETIALARGFVVLGLDELAGIEVWAAVALVVDTLAVEHLRPALAVQLRDTVKGQHVSDHANHRLGDRRAAGHLDDGLVRDHLVHRRGLRRVRLGGLHAAP